MSEQHTLPDRKPGVPAEQQGLFRRYEVYRTDRTDVIGGKHHGCEYFVLDVTHDQYAKAALIAYALACKDTHPELSKDLLARHAPLPTPVEEREPAAWLREDGMKSMPADEKDAWVEAGQPEIAEDYTIPLYLAATHPKEPTEARGEVIERDGFGPKTPLRWPPAPVAAPMPARRTLLQRISEWLEDGNGPDLEDLLENSGPRPRLSAQERDQLAVIVQWARLPAAAAPDAAQQEPALPFDVTVGHATFRKGVALQVFIDAAKRWHREAFPEGYTLTDEQKAANLARLQGGLDGATDR